MGGTDFSTIGGGSYERKSEGRAAIRRNMRKIQPQERTLDPSGKITNPKPSAGRKGDPQSFSDAGGKKRNPLRKKEGTQCDFRRGEPQLRKRTRCPYGLPSGFQSNRD